jgi:flagellar basal body rod protein FlgG
MNIAFYTAVSGMVAYQRDLDGIAHNMANVNTTGYKPSKSTFEEILYTQTDTNAAEEHLVGHGVKTEKAAISMKEGTLVVTDRQLDFAIIGSGFFAVDSGSKVKEYTRNGSFAIGQKGSKSFLVTEEGNYVLDKSKRKIEIKKDSETGLLDMTTVIEKIGVYTVENPEGFTMSDNGRFLESVNTGKIKGTNITGKNLTYKLQSGALELSAAEISEEMIQMMQSQRAFQINARVLQTADSVEEVINNLR